MSNDNKNPTESALPGTGLTPYELACLTACVPVSGNPQIDELIAIRMKLNIATEMMAALIATDKVGSISYPVERSLEYANALIAEFFTQNKKS